MHVTCYMCKHITVYTVFLEHSKSEIIPWSSINSSFSLYMQSNQIIIMSIQNFHTYSKTTDSDVPISPTLDSPPVYDAHHSPLYAHNLYSTLIVILVLRKLDDCSNNCHRNWKSHQCTISISRFPLHPLPHMQKINNNNRQLLLISVPKSQNKLTEILGINCHPK